jgi:hypothetical protein
MALCQRYFASTFGNGVAPAQNAGKTGCLTTYAFNSSVNIASYWQFPVSMRSTAPTITTYNPSNTNANWRDFTAASDFTVSVDPQSTLGASGVFIQSSTQPTQGHVCGIHATAGAEL